MAKEHSQYWIRPGVEADQMAVLHCLAAAFEPYRDDYTAQAFADTVPDARGYLERLRKMHVLVADSESGIAGTVAGECEGTQGHLRGMAVLPEWRGTGLAADLLLTIENWLRTQGCGASGPGHNASSEGSDFFL